MDTTRISDRRAQALLLAWFVARHWIVPVHDVAPRVRPA